MMKIEDVIVKSMLDHALDNIKGFSYSWTFDFENDEIEKLNNEELQNLIMLKIRPDTSKMNRIDRLIFETIPDQCVKDIDSIMIEKFIAEETRKPRIKVNVIMKN